MVVMDLLEINDHDEPFSLYTKGSYQRFSSMSLEDLRPLENTLTNFIHELHAHGYVHGDLRDANLFARDDGTHMKKTTTPGFMILDFEWAGQIGSDETRYPMYLNRDDIHRPSGARGGMKIEVEHDLDMLRYLFSMDFGTTYVMLA